MGNGPLHKLYKISALLSVSEVLLSYLDLTIIHLVNKGEKINLRLYFNACYCNGS